MRWCNNTSQIHLLPFQSTTNLFLRVVTSRAIIRRPPFRRGHVFSQPSRWKETIIVLEVEMMDLIGLCELMLGLLVALVRGCMCNRLC